MAKQMKGRLTNAVKRDILHAVEKDLNGLKNGVFKKRSDFAVGILKEAAGKHWEAINNLPDEFISKIDRVYFELTKDQVGEVRKYNHNHYHNVVGFELLDYTPGAQHQRIPISTLTRFQRNTILDLMKETFDVDQSIVKAASELKDLLGAHTTIQSLIVAWPEVEKYLPEAPEKIKSLPAIQLTSLKSALSLASAA